MNNFLARLSAVVGSGNVLTADQHDLTNWEQDWRGRLRGKALAVVRPGSTAEVAEVVRLCAQARTPIVPQGGNTGLVGGSIPREDGAGIVLSLQRMNRIRGLDERNLTITVEAGCVLQALQEAAARAGYLFPLSLAAEGSCTIGGNLATNAGGTQVVRFGNTRELCLGLEVVTPEGEVWNGLTGLRKDNTGYDLRDLYICSEGTLGIITAATMKLTPQPASELTSWLVVPSMRAAVDLLVRARRELGDSLTGFEAINRHSVSLLDKHLPHLRLPLWPVAEGRYFVLMESSDTHAGPQARERVEQLIASAMEEGLVEDAVLAENIEQSRQLWELRESLPLAGAREGFWIAHDISLPISEIAEFSEKIPRLLVNRFPGSRIVNFGHLGDGNLHFNVHAPEGVAPMAFFEECEEAIRDIVYEYVVGVGGSFSAEHGIGAIKRAHFLEYKSPVAVRTMRLIKAAIDPHGLFNPGRVFEPVGDA